jgi:hypothetical protein
MKRTKKKKRRRSKSLKRNINGQAEKSKARNYRELKRKKSTGRDIQAVKQTLEC